MEPISINLGVLIPNRCFMTELQRLCRKYGALLIMDEVATGFGRTGRVFASEYYDIEPDSMCVGKAMTSGLSGIGAALTTTAVGESMEEKGSFYSTYGWHPRSTHAAIATLRYIIRNRTSLLQNVAALSDYFRTRLGQMKFGRAATLRMMGLAISLDFGDEEYADNVHLRCVRNGPLVSTEGKCLLLFPALTINRDTARRGLDILERCV